MIHTRPATAADEPFLYDLYCSTRRAEIAAYGWTRAQADAFCRLQFTARNRSWQWQYPNAEAGIILIGDQPVGWLLVDRSPEAMVLVDIAVLPQHRGAGAGTSLIGTLQTEAAQSGRLLHLRVHSDNHGARRLYSRLGFAVTADDGTYCAMVWRPDMHHSSSQMR